MEIGLDATINVQANSQRLVILVVGEAARADRFSLNGYERQTSPLLEQESVISFKNMISCGSDTALSVPCMFSYLNRENYSHAKGKNMSNVLDIISRAGVEVLWRDNNSDSKGAADRITFEDYRSNNFNPLCNPECRDEGMLSGLQSYIDERPDSNILIVLHTMGSHGPAYYRRYPQAFEVFTPTCQTNQLNECSDEQINNAYDNTIVYADYFLSKVIELLKNNAEDLDTAMFYISDHGESLGENGVYLHGMPYFMAPIEQVHVPAIMWLDKSFAKEVNTEALEIVANEPLSHDNLFHTLLGLMLVETEVYDQRLDIMAK
jgi:lipid A ethanolaminephosphotransferase